MKDEGRRVKGEVPMMLRPDTRSRWIRLVVVAGAVLLGAAIWWWPTGLVPLSETEAKQIVESVWHYTRDIRLRGQELPSRLSLGDVIRAGYLKAPLGGGMDPDRVWIWTEPNAASGAQQVLLHALNADGTYSLCISDGSAHLVTASQWAEFLKALHLPATP